MSASVISDSSLPWAVGLQAASPRRLFGKCVTSHHFKRAMSRNSRGWSFTTRGQMQTSTISLCAVFALARQTADPVESWSAVRVRANLRTADLSGDVRVRVRRERALLALTSFRLDPIRNHINTKLSPTLVGMGGDACMKLTVPSALVECAALVFDARHRLAAEKSARACGNRNKTDNRHGFSGIRLPHQFDHGW